jgi:hypothetical protein
VLELTIRGWRGVVMTPRSVAEIERLRRRQQQLSTEEVVAAEHQNERKPHPTLSPGRRDASRPPILARIGGYPWMRG